MKIESGPQIAHKARHLLSICNLSCTEMGPASMADPVVNNRRQKVRTNVPGCPLTSIYVPSLLHTHAWAHAHTHVRVQTHIHTPYTETHANI